MLFVANVVLGGNNWIQLVAVEWCFGTKPMADLEDTVCSTVVWLDTELDNDFRCPAAAAATAAAEKSCAEIKSPTKE